MDVQHDDYAAEESDSDVIDADLEFEKQVREEIRQAYQSKKKVASSRISKLWDLSVCTFDEKL